MSTGKKIFISIITIVCILCLGVDIWCAFVYKYGEEKIVSNTINFGMMETTEGDKKTFLEINYYKNKDNSGVELFEIKYNYFQDENLSNFVSVGSQYVGNSIESKIEYDTDFTFDSSNPAYKTNLIGSKKNFLGLIKSETYNVFYKANLGSDASYYEYQSSNDYDFSIGNDVNAISDSMAFKVTIGGEIYSISLKNDEAVEQFYQGSVSWSELGLSVLFNKYAYLNYDFLASSLYNMCKTSVTTSSTYEVIQIADIFNYKKWDGEVYKDVKDEDNKKITTEFNNYYMIKINVHDSGATNASQSMFKQIHGNSQFNITGDYIASDYMYGKNVINVSYLDFNFIEYKDGVYVLELKDSFMTHYEKYNKSIVLDVCIDLDVLNSKNIIFGGFINKCFEDFEVFECTEKETIDGIVVEREVMYA